jgi:hypothetical protein
MLHTRQLKFLARAGQCVNCSPNGRVRSRYQTYDLTLEHFLEIIFLFEEVPGPLYLINKYHR